MRKGVAKSSRIGRAALVLVSAGLAGLGVWTYCRFLIARKQDELRARIHDRMVERQRLASHLQDTFLQSVEASKMLAEHALCHDTSDVSALRQTVSKLSDWLGQAISEGQSALAAQHSPGLPDDLAAAFEQAAEASQALRFKRFSLLVEGAPRAVHPIVRDELFRIGVGVIRNAFLHSDGDLVELRITYGHDLSVRIRENGTGLGRYFDPLRNREGIGRIGVQTRLVQKQDSGTEFTLSLLGRIAYDQGRRAEESAKKS